MIDPTDAELREADGRSVRAVLGGDRQAYGDLVRRHQARLRSVLSFYCASADEVEEFLQEAFVQAYSQLRRFDLEAPFYPWIKTIALNALRMEARRRRVRAESPLEYISRVQREAVEQDPEGDIADARGDALRRCLEGLPGPQAELLRARYREGRPLAELAGRFRTSLGAMKVRLLRLREALKSCVDRRLTAEGSP
jgi:RNA polymerase sigma-70 factor (ECF subfamily)